MIYNMVYIRGVMTETTPCSAILTTHRNPSVCIQPPTICRQFVCRVQYSPRPVPPSFYVPLLVSLAAHTVQPSSTLPSFSPSLPALPFASRGITREGVVLHQAVGQGQGRSCRSRGNKVMVRTMIGKREMRGTRRIERRGGKVGKRMQNIKKRHFMDKED